MDGCGHIPHKYYLPSTFTPIGVNVSVYSHIALFPEAKLDFVTKLSRIHY